jgi:hypothetical protein
MIEKGYKRELSQKIAEDVLFINTTDPLNTLRASPLFLTLKQLFDDHPIFANNRFLE